MNGEVFTKIVLALISILGAIITYVVVPWIKSKTSTTQRETVRFWARIAVEAAEQIFSEPKQGGKKKQYVIDFLDKKGIKLTNEELDVLIESAVKELNLTQAAINN